MGSEKMKSTNKPTKYYSSNQEKYIANKLGWECVSASGSRDCHPGDIKSDTWIGECKTHIKIAKNITIKKSWWDKIIEESITSHKFPALFVDNGDIKNLWVVVYDLEKIENYDIIDIPLTIQTNIIFNIGQLPDNIIYRIKPWNYKLNFALLMKFEIFCEIYKL